MYMYVHGCATREGYDLSVVLWSHQSDQASFHTECYYGLSLQAKWTVLSTIMLVLGCGLGATASGMVSTFTLVYKHFDVQLNATNATVGDVRVTLWEMWVLGLVQV